MVERALAMGGGPLRIPGTYLLHLRGALKKFFGSQKVSLGRCFDGLGIPGLVPTQKNLAKVSGGWGSP